MGIIAHTNIWVSQRNLTIEEIRCLYVCVIDIINNRLGIEGLDSQILCSRITRPLARKEKDLVTGTNNIKKVAHAYCRRVWSLVVYKMQIVGSKFKN